ncbi:MAG: M14 family zinc carboxypeptidase [Candidatus Aenigmatarchaeota archaeon]
MANCIITKTVLLFLLSVSIISIQASAQNQITYDLVVAQGSGTVCANNQCTSSSMNVTLNYGDSVTLSATPNSGYSFVRFEGKQGQGTSANPVTFTVAASGWIGALFSNNASKVTQIAFKAGWNMYSVPANANLSITYLRNKCNVSSSVWNYDPSTNRYVSASEIKPGMGYWFKIDSDCTVVVSGNDVQSVASLKAGWNQIGSYSLNATFNKGNCTVLSGPWKYNTPTNSYQKSTTLEPGYGYWVKTSGNCDIDETITPVTTTCDSACKAQSFASGTCRAGTMTTLPQSTQFSLVSNSRDTASNNFHTHNNLISMFKTLYDKFPGYASYETIGKTYEGRDIVLFKIGNPDGGTVLWDGAMHGWEDAGSEVEYLIAKWLLESGTTGTDVTAKRILDRNLILFVPVINMDSYERQNRDFASCQYGTDLNRNFGTGWYNTPCADFPVTYHGDSAASEKETQAMRSVFSKYKPDFYMNIHYGGGQYMNSASNTMLDNNLIQRIGQISTDRGVVPYEMTVSDDASSGLAYADAKAMGVSSSWYMENNDDSHNADGTTRSPTCSCYMHTCDTYQDVENIIYPRMLPILIGMASLSEVEPPTATCQSGESPIDGGCSSGTCCCSGTSTQSQVTINTNSIISQNKLSLGTQLTFDTLKYFPSTTGYQARTLMENANIKIVRLFDKDFKSPFGHQPCTSWDEATHTGTFDWTIVDPVIDSIISSGATPLVNLLSGIAPNVNEFPSGMPKSSTGLPSPQDAASYASAWAQHFKDKNYPVQYYEISNEIQFYIFTNGWTFDSTAASKEDNFIAVYNAAAAAIKSVNPNAKVSFDFSWENDVMNYWLDNDGADLDSINFHRYDEGAIGQYTDQQMFATANSQFSGNSGIGDGNNVLSAQNAYYNKRHVTLPLIDSESGFCSSNEGGSEPRIQKMSGAVWLALLLRTEIIEGVSYHNFFTWDSSMGYQNTNNLLGQGFGIINADDSKPWYPYYVYQMIGPNLAVGDDMVSSSSDSNDILSLAWKDSGKLNVLLIHTGTDTSDVSLQGISGQFTYQKIDDPSGTSFLMDSAVQTGTVNAGDSITLNGYTVMLLEQTECSDGTTYGSCSATKPKYCSSGTLISNCQLCCDSGVCQADGTCKTSQTSSKVNLDVILLKDISFYVVGDTCTDGNCCNVYKPGYQTPVMTFEKNANYKTLKPSDPSVSSYSKRILLNPKLSSSDIQQIKSDTSSFISMVKTDSGGSIEITPIYLEIPYSEITMNQWGCEFWIDPVNIKSLLSGQISKETDFTMAVSNIYDSGQNACPQMLPICGGMRGADWNFFGSSYDYVPFVSDCIWYECANTKTFYHEWIHQLDYALENIIKVSDIYSDNNFPQSLCGNADSNPLKWFPSPDTAGTDPDFYSCSNYYGSGWTNYCNSILPVDCDYQWDKHLLSVHYDHSTNLIGNYCRNGVKDFDEEGTDCGGSCSACPNSPPTADAKVGNAQNPTGKSATITEGSTVYFDGSTYSTDDGTIVKYEWDFNGDGTYDWKFTTDGKTSRTYTAGTYTAKLRVTDDMGATATDTVTITATASSPTCSDVYDGTSDSSTGSNVGNHINIVDGDWNTYGVLMDGGYFTARFNRPNGGIGAVIRTKFSAGGNTLVEHNFTLPRECVAEGVLKINYVASCSSGKATLNLSCIYGSNSIKNIASDTSSTCSPYPASIAETAITWHICSSCTPDYTGMTSCIDNSQVQYQYLNSKCNYEYIDPKPCQDLCDIQIGDCVQKSDDCLNYVNNGNLKDRLDILFIPDGYTDMSVLSNDVKSASDYILSQEPFKTYANKINIRWMNLATSFGCDSHNCYTTGNVCPGSTSSNRPYDYILSECPADKVFVIINNSPYGGCAGGRDAWINRGVGGDVFVHEFGHSFGGLWDEYVYPDSPTATSDPDASKVNCDTSTCSKWNGVSGTGCFQGCTFTNWYRPTASCVMNCNSNIFCPVCTNRLASLLSKYS